MTTRLRRTCAAAVLTLLAVGQTGTASAQSLVERDAHADVRSSPVDGDTSAPEPTVTDGDIESSLLTHGRYRIGVRIKFADLQKAGDYRGHVVQVVTNEGVHRDVVLSVGPNMWSGMSEMDRPSGAKVRCAVRHSIDYTNHVVTIGFPRSCVSNPRWVRLGVGSFSVAGETAYADDVLLANKIYDNSLALSARLRRA
jgi:hypothetical protein